MGPFLAAGRRGNRTVKIRKLLCGAALAGISPVAVAQTAELSDADEIIVEGSRLLQTTTEIGSSVSVITAEMIDQLGFDFAVDAIAAAPGVTVNQNGGFGGVASIRIRGASSEQTLVLIDGVPVNDASAPGGGFDFSRLDTESIERIEILKGPQSTLWGGDAIGGVVSVITKRPTAGFGATGFAEYGSFNTFRGGAAVDGASDVGDFRIAVAGLTTDGISKADEDDGNTEEDPFDSLTLSGRGGLNLGDARLEVSALWNDASTDFDSFDFSAPGNVSDGDELSETEEFNGIVTFKAPLFDGRLENLLLFGYSEISRENFTNGAPGFSAEGDRLLYRYQGTFTLNASNKIAFGAEREESDANGEDTAINGFFGLYEVKPIAGVTLTGGVRVDDHETFGSETTGRVALAYNPTPNITLRGSWGQGFKAPTIFQTTFFCCGAVGPNADLKPERSSAFDVGAEWRSNDGRTHFSVTYFNQDTEDQIDFSFFAGGYENIARVKSQGVEVSGALQVADWLRVSADYAYLDAEDGDGFDLARLPTHSGDAVVAIDPAGPLSGAILVRYNGEEEIVAGGPFFTSTLDDWVRVDLNARYALNETIELYGRVENLFDEDYQQIFGYGTPGLSGSFGVRLRM